MGTEISMTEYRGWPGCRCLENDTVRLVLTADVGPRIIYYGYRDGANLLYEDEAQAGKTGGDEWRIYGGHRLWHSPESRERTYFADNFPVKVETAAGSVSLIQPVESTTGIEKRITVSLAETGSIVTVRHSLTNRGLWEIELAPWAITAMAPGGTAIAPLNREYHPEGLLPNRVIVLWPYSDPADTRLSWREDKVLVRQDPGAGKPFKIGLNATAGWAAYLLGESLFVKEFVVSREGRYPDYGASVEIYTNAQMLELESLGPLSRLLPGETVEHIESWSIHGPDSALLAGLRDLAHC